MKKCIYLEVIGEVRIITTTLRLKVSEILEFCGDHQHVVHHFFFRTSFKFTLLSLTVCVRASERDLWVLQGLTLFFSLLRSNVQCEVIALSSR